MFEEYVFEKNAAFFKVFYDKFVGVFYEHSLIGFDGVDKSAPVVYHLYERKIVFLADERVVLAERGAI